METTKTARNTGIDLLKSVAIVGVIVIHTCYDGYSNPILSFDWLSTVFWGSMVRASVPIFFMCSGALMMNPSKELPVKKLYARKLLRIVVSMFAWAFAYKAYHLLVSGAFSADSVVYAIKEVLLFRQEFHLYFLQIMVIVYAFLPVIRINTRHASKRELEYALALWFLLGIVYPTVRPFWPFTLLSGFPLQWAINMTYAAIGYGLLGYYLTQHLIPAKYSVLLLAAGFLIVSGGTAIMSQRTGALYENFFEGMTVGVALLAVGIFGLCYNYRDGVRGKAAIIVAGLSKASFCIYLVHVFWLYIIGALISVNDFPCIISIPAISCLNLAASYCTYLVLSKIPVINKWLM